MRYTPFYSFANLLDANNELRNFASKLENLSLLQQAVFCNLDPILANNCQVANLRDGNLILSTNSPAWNHKLRFASSDLLSALRSDPRWAGLKSIDIRVDYLPHDPNDTTTSSKMPKPMSKKGASVLAELAQAIPDTKLSESLRKLSKRLMPPLADVDKQ